MVVRPKKDDPKLPDAGLFLSFEGTLDFARVRLRTGTKFDLILAEVMPGNAGDLGDRYALAVADEEDWVKFIDPLVVKTGKMEDECLFQRLFFQTKPPSWKIVANNKFLKMGGKWLKQYDEDAESSELSFVTSKDTEPVSEKKNVGLALTSYSLPGFGINNKVNGSMTCATDSVGVKGSKCILQHFSGCKAKLLPFVIGDLYRFRLW